MIKLTMVKLTMVKLSMVKLSIVKLSIVKLTTDNMPGLWVEIDSLSILGACIRFFQIWVQLDLLVMFVSASQHPGAGEGLRQNLRLVGAGAWSPHSPCTRVPL